MSRIVLGILFVASSLSGCRSVGVSASAPYSGNSAMLAAQSRTRAFRFGTCNNREIIEPTTSSVGFEPEPLRGSIVYNVLDFAKQQVDEGCSGLDTLSAEEITRLNRIAELYRHQRTVRYRKHAGGQQSIESFSVLDQAKVDTLRHVVCDTMHLNVHVFYVPQASVGAALIDQGYLMAAGHVGDKEVYWWNPISGGGNASIPYLQAPIAISFIGFVQASTYVVQRPPLTEQSVSEVHAESECVLGLQALLH